MRKNAQMQKALKSNINCAMIKYFGNTPPTDYMFESQFMKWAATKDTHYYDNLHSVEQIIFLIKLHNPCRYH